MSEPTPNAVGVDPVEVITGLRRDAEGLLRQSAAVDLLVAHRYWLRQSAFLARVAWFPPDAQGPGVAVPDWSAIGVLLDYGAPGFGASESQRCVLGVAASLAGGYRVDLRDVAFCDPVNVELIATAIRAAGGQL